MTKNQIEYLKLQELQRSNRANEALTEKRDTTTRELGFANLGETSRHNLATERHNTLVLGETQRHNYAQEAHNSAVLDETSRHNLAMEAHNERIASEQERSNRANESVKIGGLSLEASKLFEQQRHSRVTELEQERSNRARELETSRSNRIREAETRRSNLQNEMENKRRNIASERQRQQELDYNYASLAELAKYHSMNVGLGYSQLNEQTRANQAREAENIRSNMANEAERNRANLAQEVELIRSNRAREDISSRQLGANILNDMRNYNLNNRKFVEQKRATGVAEGQKDAEILQRGWDIGLSTATNVMNSRNLPAIVGLFG